jgi:hypothetical protein
MNKLLTGFMVAMGLTVALSGCGREQLTGTGEGKQEVRNVAEFAGINVNGNYEIVGSMGSPQKVVLFSNENLLPYITSTVKSSVLMIDTSKSADIKPTIIQKMWFFSDVFDSLTLNGASKFQFLDLKAKKLVISLTGAHQLLFSGTGTDIDIVINGNSDVDAKNLAVENATIEINGSSSVLINPSKTLKIKINGNGKVIYFNKEPKIEQTINGSGQVINGFGMNQQKS